MSPRLTKDRRISLCRWLWASLSLRKGMELQVQDLVILLLLVVVLAYLRKR